MSEQEQDFDTSNWKQVGVNIDGWYQPEITGRIVGRVLEHFVAETDFGPQDVVKVRLALPAAAVIKDKERAQLNPGQVIAVRISVALTQLPRMVEHQCAVEIVPGAKVKLGKKTMYKYDVRYQGTLSAESGARPAVAKESESELPF